MTLGTTGITSTDVKLWLQTQVDLEALMDKVMAQPVSLGLLSPHDMLDVTEAEFERDRPQTMADEVLPAPNAAPAGDLTAVALPQELAALSELLTQWGLLAAPARRVETQENLHWRDIDEAVLQPLDGEHTARYAQVAYKTQLLPLLGDTQAQVLPGATGELARQPWRVAWQTALVALDHPAVSHLSAGHLRSIHAKAADASEPMAQTPAAPSL